MTLHDDDTPSTSRLIADASAGVDGASEELFRRVYDELRLIAGSRIAGEGRAPADGEATDLVHEAYARLGSVEFENRRHLFLTYARVMRNILVDRARRNRALKRGGHAVHLPLDDARVAGIADAYRVDAIEGAELLRKLRAEAPHEADVFELRFFGGLSYRDIAAVLGVTEHAVRAGWARGLELIRHWSDATRP